MLRHMLLLLICALTAVNAAAQPGWPPKNLQVYPKDITREALTQRMREFSFALSVRCQYCHAGGDGISFDGVDFSSDEKPAKVKARAMLRMTGEINGPMLAKIPARAEPRVEVTCATCHRGLAIPKSLQTTLFEMIAKDGTATAAIARYKQLRADNTAGAYNLAQWEVMELARRLVEAKNTGAAIDILAMIGEYYPKSADVDFQIAELHLARGEKDKARARYQTTLEKAPNYTPAKTRLAELEKP